MSRNINLYDPSLRMRRDLLTFEAALTMVGAAFVVVLITVGAARWAVAVVEPVAARSSADLEALQGEAQALAAHIAAVKPDAAMQAEIAAAQRKVMQRRAALQALDGNAADRDGGFSSRLEALARQSVEGLWLTGMALRGNDVLLKGRALTPSLIPVYVQRLDREASLQGNAFRALEVSRPIESAAKAATPTATPVADAAPAGSSAPRAEFVEFTLIGVGVADVAPPANGGRP